MIQLITIASLAKPPFHDHVLLINDSFKSEELEASDISISTLMHHWNDASKVEKDFWYIERLTSKILSSLTKELNSLHNISYSERQWNLIIGLWLKRFITVTYDRWTMIKLAQKKCPKLTTYLIDEDWVLSVPLNSAESNFQFISDKWNHIFYGYLIEKYTSIKVEKKNFKFKPNQLIESTPLYKKISLNVKKKFKNIVLNALKIIFLGCRNNNYRYALPASELSLGNIFYLGLILKGYISTELNLPKITSVDYNKGFRDWKISSEICCSDFEKMVIELIPLWIPRSFIEGFNQIKCNLQSEVLHNNPDVIFSSNSHYEDDVFKIWCSECFFYGSKFVIGLHGGGVPYKFHASLKYEEEICDLYVAVGEGYDYIKHSRSVGQFWTKLKFGKWNPKGNLLVVTMSTHKYCVELRSMVRSNNMLIYLDNLYKFYGLLSTGIQKKTIIRLQKIFPFDVWDSRRRWLGRYPSAILDDGHIPISFFTSNARICVATYQGTFYLESLAANIPTIFFWDVKFWGRIAGADDAFLDLKSVGIFHESPESASIFITKVWDDIGSWWNNPELQKIREEFCRKYAYRDASVITKLADVLGEAATVKS